MSGQPSPYPGTPPPAPVYVPLQLYISEREFDRHQREAERAEGRAWMASIARDVKTLLAAHHAAAGAAEVAARQEEDAAEIDVRASDRRWSVWLSAISAFIGAAAAVLTDFFRGG